MDNYEFSIIVNFEALSSPEPSHIFTVLISKFKIVQTPDDLRTLMDYLTESAKTDSVMQAIYHNTCRALDTLRHGDELFNARTDPDMPKSVRNNLNVALNCMVSDAVKSVRVAHEIVAIHKASNSPPMKDGQGNTLQ